MSPLAKSVLIFVGAGLGGNARYWIGERAGGRWMVSFPWGTFFVNLTGSVLIGFVAGILLEATDPLPWRMFLITGFLGGYTTFSSFSLESLELIAARSYGLAAANILGSVFLGLAGAWVGISLARWLLHS